MNQPVHDGAPRRALSVNARNGWMLLALLPGAVMRGHASGSEAWIALVDAMFIAAICEAGIAFARKRPATASGYRESVLLAALAALWRPPSLPAWVIATAAIAAVACRRLVFANGPSPFHPAMLGCSLAMLAIASAKLPIAPDPEPALTAIAFASGGIALAVGRCIRWQVPLAILLPLGVGMAALGSIEGPKAGVAWAPFLPILVLTAFFIATDPSSGCMSPRARWCFGAAIGVMSIGALYAFHGIAVLFGLAGAVLLANAAAPWLDRIVGHLRAAAPFRTTGA